MTVTHIPSNKPIGILLPSTNKALAAVLKNATPEQLAVLSQPKDIKSILSDLLHDHTPTLVGAKPYI